MSDNLKRYRAIRDGLKQFFPKQRTPRQWQHFRVMAAMINGIVGSRHVHLPKLADKFPSRADRESRIKRFARWLQNTDVTQASYFAPFAEALLVGLAAQPLVLVIDGSTVGRGCQSIALPFQITNTACLTGSAVCDNVTLLSVTTLPATGESPWSRVRIALIVALAMSVSGLAVSGGIRATHRPSQ